MNHETEQLDLEEKAKTAAERDMEYVAWFGRRYGACEPMHNILGSTFRRALGRATPHHKALYLRDDRVMRRKKRMRLRARRGRWC